VARNTDFAWRGRCDLSHRLSEARKSRSGINPDLRPEHDAEE
jgi:hypothetical protein